jgi:hypothetical protein
MKYNPEMAINRYKTLDQIREDAKGLHTAEMFPLQFRDWNPTTGATESRFWSIKNMNTKQEICPATGDYSLIQHIDAVNWVLDSIQEAGIDGHGVLRNWGNQFKLEVFFDNFQFRDPTGEEFFIGCSLASSYSKQVGLYINPYIIRGVCSNGQIFKGGIGNVNTIYARHTGNVIERVGASSIKEMVNSIASVQGTILTMIDKANNDVITFQKVEDEVLTISKFVGGTRRAKAIIEEYNIPLTTTRLELYNIFNEYGTWTDKLSFQVQDDILSKSEELLRKGLKIDIANDVSAIADALPLAI